MKYFIVLIFILAITGTGSAKVSEYADSSLPKIKKHKMTIKEVLAKHTDKWMEIPGVIGTGEGMSEAKPCITIFMASNVETIKKKIPKKVEGYKVVFEETGEIEARSPK